MKEGSRGGASLCEGFHDGGIEGRLLYWATRKMRFLRDMQSTLQTGLPLYRSPMGEPGGGSFASTFERKRKYIWVPFLDPEAIKILSLEAIWNFSQGTRLS
jgi:hypothetical protein